MKQILFAALLATGCVDEQNVGNTSTSNTTHIFNAPRWALSLGDVYDDVASAVAIAGNGDVVVAGGFAGTVDFGGSVHATGTDFLTSGSFLTRRAAADGHEVWTLTQAQDEPSLTKVAMAPDDTIVGVGGYIRQGLWDGHVGPVQQPQLSKRDANGAVLWHYDFDLGVNLWSVAVGANGRIAVGGSYQKTIMLPSGEVSNPSGDAFIEVFDAGGTPLWGLTSDTLALAPFPEVDVVRFTAEGDLVIAGVVHELTTLDHVPIQNNGRNTAFAARFTTDGHLIWSKVLSDADHEEYAGFIFVDGAGRTTIGGSQRAYDDTSGNGRPLEQFLDATGAMMSSYTAVSGSAGMSAMTITAAGTIVTTGGTSGFPIDLGTGTISACEYLAAQSSDGTLLEAVPLVGPGATSCGQSGIDALDSRGGSLAAVGQLDGSIDLGSGALRFAGGTDAVIAMYDVP